MFYFHFMKRTTSQLLRVRDFTDLICANASISGDHIAITNIFLLCCLSLRCCFYECTSQWLHSRAASSPCLYEFSFGRTGGEEPQWKYWAEQIYSSRPTVNAISCSLSYTPHNAINRKHFLFSSLLWSLLCPHDDQEQAPLFFLLPGSVTMTHYLLISNLPWKDPYSVFPFYLLSFT